MTDALRDLPSVDRLLARSEVGALIERCSRQRVVEALRAVLGGWRERIRAGQASAAPSLEALLDELQHTLERAERPRLTRVFNATGVVIHTNLGRAPLSPAALAAAGAVGGGYSNLEYELEAGQRGSRHDLVTEAVRQLTGAEAALVVNNNAAALLLVLSALAVGREVIISRGQLVEIGGGFRIPDVLRQSGARLVEVGTTNRTYAADYRAVAGPETALLLRVHSSNFRVVGFVHEATIAELAAVARERELLLVDDLGSGSLLDTAQYGLAREPMVQQSVREGADLVCFSGDKLLGGPQCGLIVGRANLVAALKRHPLTRAVRPDKLTLGALEATLQHYLRGEAEQRVPVWRMIAARPAEIEARADVLAARLRAVGVETSLLDGASAVGGGSLPGETLPTRLLRLESPEPAVRLAARLRALEPPVVARIERDRVVLDLRTVLPEEDVLLAKTLAAGLGRPAGAAVPTSDGRSTSQEGG